MTNPYATHFLAAGTAGLGAALMHVSQSRLPDLVFNLILLVMSLVVLIAVAGCFFLGWWLPLKSGKTGGTGVVLFWGLFGLAAWSGMNLLAWQQLHQQLDGSAWQDQVIGIEGQVIGLPQHQSDGWRFVLQLQASETPLPDRVLLSWADAGAELRAGEHWWFLVKLKLPRAQVNPNGFDFEAWLYDHGIAAVGSVRSNDARHPPHRISVANGQWLHVWRQSVRDEIERAVTEPRLAGLIAALTIGDQAAVERTDWDIFRTTGVAHLMSISGMHVTLFAAWLRMVISWVWRRLHWRQRYWSLWLPTQTVSQWIGLITAGIYAAFSGWGLPAQRTVWMLGLLAALGQAGLHWPTHILWWVVLSAVVLFDPMALLQPGFWLSYVAVGILFGSGSVHVKESRAGFLKQLFSAQWAEQWRMGFALAPLSLLLFQQISLVGLVANLIAIPWVTWVVTPLAMVGLFVSDVWLLAAWSLKILMGCLEWFAKFPWAVLTTATPPVWAGMMATIAAALAVWPLPLSWRVWGASFSLALWFWRSPAPDFGEFELLALDVGQGSAILIRTSQHQMLFDAGPRYSTQTDAGQRVVVPLLASLNLRLDRLILSHSDIDHTGGAQAVMKMQPQLSKAYECERGQSWWWDGVYFEILHPPPPDLKKQKTNARSCVLRMVSANKKAALLTGDIEAEQELELLLLQQNHRLNLQADLLMVPHHGSKTSSTDGFIEAVHPAWAVAQSGYKNRFGHPAAEVLQRYVSHGAVWFNSVQCGALTWRSNAVSPVCERALQPHFWQSN
jgi:competence protein ComEC